MTDQSPYLAHVRDVLARLATALESPRNLFVAHDIKREIDPFDALEVVVEECDRLAADNARLRAALRDLHGAFTDPRHRTAGGNWFRAPSAWIDILEDALREETRGQVGSPRLQDGEP